MKNFIIGAVVVLAAIALGVAGGRYTAPASSQHQLGATPGSDFSNMAYFMQDAIVGGNNLATSSIGTATYTAAQVMNYKTITHTAASALTVTLPASSTMGSYMNHTGDTKSLFILPVTTGITFAGGTGTDLDTASSTKFCVAGALCEMRFVRKSNSDIEVLLLSGL